MKFNYTMGSNLFRALLYLVGTFLQKGGMFLFIPLVAYALSREDISRYALYTSALALFVPLATQNIQLAGERISFDYPSGSPERNTLNVTVLIAAFVSTGVASILLASIAFAIAALDLHNSTLTVDYLVSLVLLGMIAISTSVSQASQTVMRVNGDAFAFAFSTSIRVLVALGVFGGAVAIGQYRSYLVTLNTLLLAFTFGGVASCVAAFLFTRNDYLGGVWNSSMFWIAWKYAAPTSLHVAIGALNSTGGRWIGESFLGLDALAEYSVLSMILVGMGTVSRSCIEGCRPAFMKAFAVGDLVLAEREVIRATAMAVGAVALTYLGLVMVLWSCFAFRIGKVEFTSLQILLTGIASAIDAVYLYGIGVLLGLKKSRDPAVVSMFSCVMSVGVAFLFCAIAPSSSSLLLAQIVACSIQCALFIVWAKRRLKIVMEGSDSRELS